MAGTIIADVIQSDQSYPSSINIASPVIISNTFAFPAGTVSAPAFFPTGDTNTGIFFPAADTIAFAEGGVEAMRIDANGNVGIGTTAPPSGFRLDVSGGTFAVRDATNGRIILDDSGVADASTPIQYLQSDDGAFIFGNANRTAAGGTTSSTERMRITSDGYFGFAVTSPQERLHLANRQFSSQTFRTVGAYRGGLGNNPTNAIIFYANVPYVSEPGICETWLLNVTAVAQANLNQTGNRIATFLMHINRAGNNGGGGSTTTNINFTSLGTQLDTKTGSLGVSGNITMSANIPSASTGTHTCDIRVSFTNSSGASDTRCHISGFVLGSTTAQVTTITYP